MTLVTFQTVELDPDLARELKRLTIRLAARGIRLRPVDSNSGARTIATIRDMRTHPAKYRITAAAAAGLSDDSPHRYGLACDLSIVEVNSRFNDIDATWRKRIGANTSAIYDYAEHVASHYGLNVDRPLYPARAGERNHFVLDSRVGIKPLSASELVQYRRALKL